MALRIFPTGAISTTNPKWRRATEQYDQWRGKKGRVDNLQTASKISVGLSCHFADDTGLDNNSYEEQNLACDDTQREFPA